MSEKAPVDAFSVWLPVIGKALAYLCLQEARKKDPKKFDTVLKQVKFFEGLGLSRKDAAEAAGSSAESVRVMHQKRKSARTKNGSAKDKSGRRRSGQG